LRKPLPRVSLIKLSTDEFPGRRSWPLFKSRSRT